MPKIIKNDAQMRACDEIVEQLDHIKTINQAILSLNQASFTLSFGRKKSMEIDAVYNDKLGAILRQQRNKRIKEIQAKAAKFRIALDEDEKKLISDDAILLAEGSGEAEEPQENAAADNDIE